VHVKSEYDYQFESEFRKEIFDAFKHVYYTEFGTNLPVYGVPDKLKDYATSKKDISNGVEVNPREEYRIHSEDRYQETGKGNSGSVPNNNSGNFSTQDSFSSEIDAFNDEVQ
jgi:hypothetical protein